MANILCIESSYRFCSVAFSKGDDIFLQKSDLTMNHAEAISTLIQNCLSDAECGFSDIQALALSDGPGSYTGLRIGASTAKGVCFALGVPLIKISTLKSLAYGARKLNPQHEGLFWPMADARRMEVYHTLYDKDLNKLQPITSGIIDMADFRPEMASEHTLLCGDGAFKAVGILQLKDAGVFQCASNLCALAQEAFMVGDFTDPESYEPFYLKQANITGPLANNKA